MLTKILQCILKIKLYDEEEFNLTNNWPLHMHSNPAQFNLWPANAGTSFHYLLCAPESRDFVWILYLTFSLVNTCSISL